MEGKRLQEFCADKKGRLIQAVGHYCEVSRTGSNTTTKQIRRIVAVLEEMRSTRESQWEGICQVGFRSISDELSIEEPLDSTSTSYLAAKVEMEDAPASIRRRKRCRLLRPSWRSHNQPLPGCWATTCNIRKNNTVPNPTFTSSRSNMPFGI